MTKREYKYHLKNGKLIFKRSWINKQLIEIRKEIEIGQSEMILSGSPTWNNFDSVKKREDFEDEFRQSYFGLFIPKDIVRNIDGSPKEIKEEYKHTAM